MLFFAVVDALASRRSLGADRIDEPGYDGCNRGEEDQRDANRQE